MNECSQGLALVRLLTWLSPGFPTGAFAYSHGLEAAIGDGILRDRGTVQGWIAALLHHGSGWNDLVLLCAAWRAARDDDRVALDEVAELSVALAGSLERRQETTYLGAAFLEAASPWAPVDGPLPYPVAVGAVSALGGVGVDAAAEAYAHAFVANLAMAAARLVPVGQRDTVGILHALEGDIVSMAGKAASTGLDGLGSAAFLSEIAAMRHETQKTRVFRS